MSNLPYNNVRKIMRNALGNNGMEVSRGSVELMRELAEEYITRRTLKTMMIAKDGKKRRITKAHVELTI